MEISFPVDNLLYILESRVEAVIVHNESPHLYLCRLQIQLDSFLPLYILKFFRIVLARTHSETMSDQSDSNIMLHWSAGSSESEGDTSPSKLAIWVLHLHIPIKCMA